MLGCAVTSRNSRVRNTDDLATPDDREISPPRTGVYRSKEGRTGRTEAVISPAKIESRLIRAAERANFGFGHLGTVARVTRLDPRPWDLLFGHSAVTHRTPAGGCAFPHGDAITFVAASLSPVPTADSPRHTATFSALSRRSAVCRLPSAVGQVVGPAVPIRNGLYAGSE